MFRSYDLWVMSPTRFRCANSLSAGSRRGWGRQKNPPQHDKKRPCAVLGRGTEQQKDKSGGSGYRSRFSTLRRLYATMYNNPPSASFGTRTRTYTLEGCNSTLKLRMQPLCRGGPCLPRTGSPVERVIAHKPVVEWPSGLRRSTQVRVSSEAWVRTPLQP